MFRNCEFVSERYATGAATPATAIVATAGFGGTINCYQP
jgi:hypothetical protein